MTGGIQSIRNIGVVAHIDAGKTTLTTRLLHCSGRIHRIGEVDEGTAPTDPERDERERGISITAAATVFPWAGHRIQLVDTPGHVDFTIEVERSLRVLDGAVVVFCAVHGVQAQSETVWRQADKFGIPRLAFVNKMDLPGASLDRVVAEMEERLRTRAAVLQMPFPVEDRFGGVIDLLSMKALVLHGDPARSPDVIEIPEDLREPARLARESLVEAVADADDALAAVFLGGDAVDAESLRSAIRRACLARRLVPVLCGAARRNQGYQPLLDAVVAYLPSPADLPQVKGVDPERPEVTLARRPEEHEPFSALAFKVRIEGHHKTAFLRIFSGTLRRRDTVLNVRTGRRAKITEMLEPHADRPRDLDAASVGDIVMVKGLRDLGTGDSVTAPDAPILLERIDVREPVVSMAIEPEHGADRDRLTEALSILEEEDPSFHVEVDEQSGQTLISGMGELHLEIVTGRLRRDHRVDCRVSRPQVLHRQAVTASASGRSVFHRDTGEVPLHGEVTCRVEPRSRGEGNAFRCAVPEEPAVPAAWLDAALSGLRDAARSGSEGDPLEDALVTLVAVEARPEGQPEVALRSAAVQALRRAIRNAAPVRLEPIMAIEVLAPEESMGPVIHDLNARHGQVQERDWRGDRHIVRALVPLREMFGYVTRLRSISSGRGEYTMEFSAYDVAPS